MMAECDACGYKRPARHAGLHGYVAPPLWFQMDTSDPRCKILACSKKCADAVDVHRAMAKAIHLQDKPKG